MKRILILAWVLATSVGVRGWAGQTPKPTEQADAAENSSEESSDDGASNASGASETENAQNTEQSQVSRFFAQHGSSLGDLNAQNPDGSFKVNDETLAGVKGDLGKLLGESPGDLKITTPADGGLWGGNTVIVESPTASYLLDKDGQLVKLPPRSALNLQTNWPFDDKNSVFTFAATFDREKNQYLNRAFVNAKEAPVFKPRTGERGQVDLMRDGGSRFFDVEVNGQRYSVDLPNRIGHTNTPSIRPKK